MAPATFALPLRNPFESQSTSEDQKLSQKCTLKYGSREWCVPTSSICEASPFLQQLLKYNAGKECLDLSLISHVAQANQETVTAVVDFLRTSDLEIKSPTDPDFELGEKLEQCARVYVLAHNLQISELTELALEEWTATMNSCLFGSIRAVHFKKLLQYIFSSTERNDTGLRPEAIRFAAVYHQNYLNVQDSVLTDKEVRQNCSRLLYKQLFFYQTQFPKLHMLLASEEPQAWHIAQTSRH